MSSVPIAMVILAVVSALIIERTLEVVKAMVDVLDSRLRLHRFWSRRAKILAATLESRLRAWNASAASTWVAAQVLRRAREILLGSKRFEMGEIPVVNGDLVRAFYIKVGLKLLGIALGIAFAMSIELDVISGWRVLLGQAPSGPTGWGSAATGIATGLGAGPVHKVITALDAVQRRRRAARGGTK